MSVFSSKFRNISKKAAAWSLAALTAIAGASAMPSVLTTEVKAADMLSNKDRGVIYANSRTDFRDESIYFLITTRFYDGDTSNNARTSEDKKAQNPENDPSWRGDFKGLIDKLDYIKALGFTAIWITPVVENDSGYDYHGYHAYDFSAVDKRYESNGVTYQTLIDACHAKGMKVIQDVVFNHSCNWGERNLLKLESDVFTERNSVVMNGKFGPGGQYTDTENIYHHNAYCGGGDWDNFEAQRKTIADDCLFPVLLSMPHSFPNLRKRAATISICSVRYVQKDMMYGIVMLLRFHVHSIHGLTIQHGSASGVQIRQQIMPLRNNTTMHILIQAVSRQVPTLSLTEMNIIPPTIHRDRDLMQ